MTFLGLPITTYLVSKFCSFFSVKELRVYRILVLAITFCVYLTYHLSRRSLSIVKPALNHNNCSDILPELLFLQESYNGSEVDEHWCDWAPFKGPHSRSLLGTLDLVFLISYSVSMYINGMIAERMNLRYFLTIGMLLAGICNILFGIAYYLDIHSLGYFYGIQVITGIAQSTGWPGVLAAVANWFGPTKRGLIFGIWNSHTYMGNIAGAAVAGLYVETDWGLSFIVPGLIIAATGLLVFFFLVPKPDEVSLGAATNNDEQIPVKSVDIQQKQFKFELESKSEAISILDALKISGVIEFSICLFFAKLVSYTFLDWLPLYISQTNAGISSSESAFLTIMFDVGGIVGGITAGYLADRTGASGLICIVMLVFAIPSLGIYYAFGNMSNAANMGLQFLAGIFVNAPYALITTAVSAELGSKVPSKSALATVSGIIDATGSIGSAIGPSLAGFVSEFGWDKVFIVVMLSDLMALLCLVRVGFNDCKRLLLNRRSRKATTDSNQQIISVTVY